MADTTLLEARMRLLAQRLRATGEKGAGQLQVLRQQAGDATLRWLMEHREQLVGLRKRMEGTPVATILDAMLETGRPKAARKTSKKRAKPRKTAAAGPKRGPAKRKTPSRKGGARRQRG